MLDNKNFITRIKSLYNICITQFCLYFLIEGSFFLIVLAIIKLYCMAFGFPFDRYYYIGLIIILWASWIYTLKYNNQFIDWFLYFFLSDFYMSYVNKISETFKQITKEYPSMVFKFFLSYVIVCGLYFLNVCIFNTNPELLTTLFIIYNLYYIFRCFFIMPLYLWLCITNHPRFLELMDNFVRRNPSYSMDELVKESIAKVAGPAVAEAGETLAKFVQENPKKTVRVLEMGLIAGAIYQGSVTHVDSQKTTIANANKTFDGAKKIFGISEGELPKELGKPAASFLKDRMHAENSYSTHFRGLKSDGASILAGKQTPAAKLEETTNDLIDSMQAYHLSKPKPSVISSNVSSATPSMPKEDSILDLLMSLVVKL